MLSPFSDFLLLKFCYSYVYIPTTLLSQKFGAQCPAGAKVVDLSGMKALIIQMHNVRRDRVAGGNLPGYQQARRMGTVVSYQMNKKSQRHYQPFQLNSTQQWDDELAKIALLNAKRCFMAHDACRNIPRFTRSGQNIALSSTKGMPNQLRKHLIEAIQNWFLEYKDGNMNIMNSFRDPK